MNSRIPSWILLVCVSMCLLLAGCAEKPYGTVAVRGTVTLDGEALPAGGRVVFNAVEAAQGFSLRPASGKFDTDGAYEATSFTQGDGLMPGKYIVAVHCWKVPPSMGGPPAVSYLPAKYEHAKRSGLELVVGQDMRQQEFNINLVSSK